MMPDYSNWKITLEQYVTDFERENLEHDLGTTPVGYARWVKYEDGNWYYLTEGWEQFRSIARAYLLCGEIDCAEALYKSQPDGFKKVPWGDIVPYTTIPANVPVKMPQLAVNIMTKETSHTIPIMKKGSPSKDSSESDRSTSATTVVVATGATLGVGYAIWRFWPRILRIFT